MKPNEYNMKEGENNIDSWIEVVKKIEGVKYQNFPGIKMSGVPIEKRIRKGRGDVITDRDIQLLIRILCKVKMLPNSIYASHDNMCLVLQYIYDSKNEAFFSITAERCKYNYIIDGAITEFQKANEAGIVSAINATISRWEDKFDNFF